MTDEFYFFIEGIDDKNFLDIVLRESFSPSIKIKYYLYANKKPADTSKLIKSLLKQQKNIIFFRDMDFNPCVSNCKNHCFKKYTNLKSEMIIVVNKEIESWYYAGLPLELRIPSDPFPDLFIKEKFPKLLSSLNLEKDQFIHLAKEKWNINVALESSLSFRYFYRKYSYLFRRIS